MFEKPLPAGAEAPAFEADDESGQTHRLPDYRGKPVLLVFYPGDDTPACRKQLCEIRDSWQEYRERGVIVLGVNPQDAGSHRRFAAKHRFPFPILVDAGQRIARLYRCNGLLVKRTIVLIGKDGRILLCERGMPRSATVLAALPAERDTTPRQVAH